MSKIDFSQIIPAGAKASLLEEEIVLATALLAETDWMVIREAEGGTAMPDETRAARQAARDLISKLRKELETTK